MRWCLALVFCATGAAADHVWQDRDIVAGQAIYAAHCAACHGAHLQGQPDWRSPGADGVLPAPPHDPSGHTWHHGSQALFDYTGLGGAAALARMGVEGFNSGMPGFADVIDDQAIWDVLAYIRSTWPQEIQDVQAGRDPAH